MKVSTVLSNINPERIFTDPFSNICLFREVFPNHSSWHMKVTQTVEKLFMSKVYGLDCFTIIRIGACTT